MFHQSAWTSSDDFRNNANANSGAALIQSFQFNLIESSEFYDIWIKQNVTKSYHFFRTKQSEAEMLADDIQCEMCHTLRLKSDLCQVVRKDDTCFIHSLRLNAQ